jgi:hypothetical protein
VETLIPSSLSQVSQMRVRAETRTQDVSREWRWGCKHEDRRLSVCFDGFSGFYVGALCPWWRLCPICPIWSWTLLWIASRNRTIKKSFRETNKKHRISFLFSFKVLLKINRSIVWDSHLYLHTTSLLIMMNRQLTTKIANDVECIFDELWCESIFLC